MLQAIDAIELALRDPRVEATCPTSMFLSIMPETRGTLQETSDSVSRILSDFIAANSTRLLSLRLDEIELKLRTIEAEGAHPYP